MPHSTTRRDFIRRLATGTAAGLGALHLPTFAAAATPLTEGSGSLRGLPIDEPFWDAVKARFPLRDGFLPMNSANLSPAPRSVVETVVTTVWNLEADVSAQNRAKFSSALETARERIASLMGADPQEIAIVRNASEANNIIVGGIELGPGDEVLIFDQNHQTNSISWDVQAARSGFSVRRIGFDPLPATPDEALALFVREMGSATRVVAFSDASNTTGLQLPSKAICQAARERGIYAHVDGAQTMGAVVRDLHDLGCDSYSASAHKWLMGPKETGILYVRAERIAEIWPGVVGVGWGNGAETSADGARKFESIGQRNDSTIAGLIPTVEFHQEIGNAVIAARIVELSSLLKDGIRRIPGAQLVTPMAPELSAGVVISTFPGKNTRTIYDALYREHGVAGATTGGLRLCPHVYTTRADIERVIEAIGRLAA